MAVLNGQIAATHPTISNVLVRSNANSFNGTITNDSISRLNSNSVIAGYYQNYLSHFARFFGINSYQTASQLIIQKSELPRLTPSNNNRAKALLIGLLLRVMEYESNDLLSKVSIEIDSIAFVQIDGSPYRRITLSINIFTFPNLVGREIVNYDTPLTPDEL